MASRAAPHAGIEKAWMKYLSVPGLFLTSVVVTLLLWSNRSGWTDTGQFYQLITGNRATSQIFVQILSHCLGALHVHILCALINFATRLRLAEGPAALDVLKLWSALCGVRLDLSLPLRFLVPLAAFIIGVLLPGALWAGALTPVVTATSFTSHPAPASSGCSYLSIPQYSNASHKYWTNIPWLSHWDSLRNAQGMFTYSPNYELQGRILNLAASATSRDNTTQKHAKIDNTQFSYEGRSFGVGSSVGLVDVLLNNSSTLSYNYTEIGYRAQVGCFKNSTLNWTLSGVKTSQDITYPNMYIASGTHANGASDFYAACGIRSSDEIVALAGQAYKGQNLFSIASGRRYSAFNGTQCNVTFSPTNFSVSVNLTQRMITVTPLPLQLQVPDINPGGKLIAITMRMLTSFSQLNACNLYTSVIGNTFESNINNVYASQYTTPNTSKPYDRATTFRGIEDSLTSMLDNVLLAYSSAQLMIANDTYQVPITTLITSIRVGEPIYIYAIAAINFLLVLVFLVEAARTKGWRGLKKFDYMDVKSVVVGTSMGGTAIANAAARRACASDQARQDGSAADYVAGNVAVRLDHRDDALALVYDGGDEVGSGKSGRNEVLALAEDVDGAL